MIALSFVRSQVALTAFVAAMFLVSAASAQVSPKIGAPAAKASVQLAQACGWYAISVCSRSPRGARRGARRYGGYVVLTDRIANFRPGWYCSVMGPSNKRQARRMMWRMQDDGARTAYIKYGC